MPTLKKNKQSPLYVLELMVAVLLLFVVGILTAATLMRTNVNCQKLTDETQELLTKRQYKQAYEKLLPHRKACSEPNAKNESTENKIGRLEFHHRLAVSAYVVGNKKLAENEADKGLLINKELSDSERNNVYKKHVFDMVFVKAGEY